MIVNIYFGRREQFPPLFEFLFVFCASGGVAGLFGPASSCFVESASDSSEADLTDLDGLPSLGLSASAVSGETCAILRSRQCRI